MARRVLSRVAMPNPDDRLTIHMTRREALALEKVAEIGLKANDAFSLISTTLNAERGLSAIREGMAAVPGEKRSVKREERERAH